MKLDGQVDALVFAGGIGEKGALLRTRVVEQCRCLGFGLDEQANNNKIEGVVRDIGSAGARHRTLVCQTDEQVSAPNLQHEPLAKDTESLKWRGNVQEACERLEQENEHVT